MKCLIIGSMAMYHWFPDARVPADIDLLTPVEIKSSTPSVCLVDAQWHDVGDYIMEINKDKVFADPDVLFTLKVSHAHWNIKWEKTMYDVEFLRRKGCTLNMELYDRLFKVWTELHGKKRVNMNKPMTEFFKDAVVREYDHEYLHELVAFYDRPLHERLRTDKSTAWCDRELFENLSAEDQLKTALEEMMATAIERSSLKHGCKKSEVLTAMSRAHFQLCTSMTTGWFARFLILNRYKLLSENRELWTSQITKTLLALSTQTKPVM
jgi:hypothetical protein